MNIAALKEFAPAVRRQLMEAVTVKLDYVLTARTPDYVDTYARQVAAIRRLAQEDRTGLIERVAYTWFNRLTALRFLDARSWHPFGVRILTVATADETQPELLKLMSSGHCPDGLRGHTQLDRLNGLLDGRIPSGNAQGEVYRHLVLAACRYYNALLPDVFEQLDDETELLLPDDLLTELSVAQGFRTKITDEDCAEVETIGWLYQFYISERKDEVMARKSAVPKEDIPAVTQLFTPHWIVRYLVENSLGRLWLLNYPDSRLREQMPYYIEGDPETDFLRISGPEEIEVCDPAVGSGHMLTYAFELLYAIYEEQGYGPSEIPALILRNNLHGLDICPRAAQLAELALVFKAREKSSRFFQRGTLVQPRILALRDVHFSENELRGYIEALGLGNLFDAQMLRLLHQFEEATTFGSLIQPCIDEQQIAFALGSIEVKDLSGHLFLHETHRKVLRVLRQAQELTQRYHIVVTNPPYMGGDGMNGVLKKFAKDNYRDSKSDLFATFIERGFSLAKARGFSSMVTMQSWMFISSYEQLRATLLQKRSIRTLIQIGYNSFPEMNSKVAQACAFVVMNARQSSPGVYVNLNDASQAADKELVLIEKLNIGNFFRTSDEDFKEIPRCPIAYWVPPATLRTFRTDTHLGSILTGREGMSTGSNAEHVRFWWEPNFTRISFGCETRDIANKSQRKWFPYNKGGALRRWYGNAEYVVNWENDGFALQSSLDPAGLRIWAHNFNLSYIFRPSVSWSDITTKGLSGRLFGPGYLFDATGLSAFSDEPNDLLVALALLNSTVGRKFAEILNPTMHFKTGDFAEVPLPHIIPVDLFVVAQDAVAIARVDWDNFETSWDFSDQPLLSQCLKATTLKAAWQNWETQCTAAIHRMQELETENNKLFIEAYGLRDELSPEVPAEQITLARADARRDMAAFLSYAVGCMMGRYSLDRPGLILANAGESVANYLAKVGLSLHRLTFVPDSEGIIPVLDGEWFEDDLVARTREFLRAIFGEAALHENIRFIEESLGREIRNYFLTDFYKDHLQIYKKRPIYWMAQSPQKGFCVLIYLHRYTRDTMNVVLNRYLREYQIKLRSRVAHLADVQSSSAVTMRDKSAARKEFNKLTKTLHECEDWERQVVLPLAQARIELDLDDGVKVNYLKLGEALAPIPGLAATEE